jgi:hypothetical protein
MAKASSVNVVNALAATIPTLPTLPPVPPMRIYVTGEYFYVLDLPDSIEFSLELYSMLGARVYHLEQGLASKPVLLTTIPAGLYLAKVSAPGRRTEVVKVFISR